MAESRINIKALFDLKAFSTSAQNLERSMKSTARNLESIGTKMSLAFTAPLVGLGAIALKNFDAQEKAMAQVRQGLVSTGNAAGFTTDKLKELASAIQEKSLFGDEEILQGVTAQLLTFTNIAGTQFERTQQAAVDLATRLDGDLKSASIMLGKALNDPIANLSALSRAGIQFSEEQKNTVKALVETNRLAEAQTLILAELEKQYGGSAEAAARAGLGPLKQLQMAFGDLLEDFGKIISEAILPFIDKMRGAVKWVKSLSDEQKRWIVTISGVVAAIGPLLLGLSALAVSLSFLAAHPVVLTISAIVVGLVAIAAASIWVHKNTDNFIKIFINGMVKARNAVLEMSATFLDSLSAIVKLIPGMEGAWANLQISVAKLRGEKMPVIFDKIEWHGFSKVIKDAKNNFDGLITTVNSGTSNLSGGGSKSGIAKIIDNTILEPLKSKTTQIFEAGQNIGIALSEGLQNGFDATEIKLTQFTQKINELINVGLQDTLNNLFESIGAAIATGDTKEIGRSLLLSFADFAGKLGRMIIATGVSLEAFKKSIQSLNGVAAIVAGGALIAAAAGVRAIAQGGLNGNSSGYSPSPSAVGGGGYNMQPITLSTRIEGRDMLLIQTREGSFRR